MILLLLLLLPAASGGATPMTECTSALYCPATCSGLVPGNASSYVAMAGTERKLMGDSTGERQLHSSVVRMVDAVEKRFGPVTDNMAEGLHLSFQVRFTAAACSSTRTIT